MKRQLHGMRAAPVVLMILLALGATAPATAATDPLPGGDFESAVTDFGTAGGVNGGQASKHREGVCWSYNTSWGVTFNGEYAGTVQSGHGPSSIGVLTSHPFVAGTAVRFKALSETAPTQTGPAPADPSTFSVRILDASGDLLSSRQINDENVIELERRNVGCVVGEGDPRDMGFSTHSIDTSSFAGQTIKVQFRQHTNVDGHGFATLVDNVKVVDVRATASIAPAKFYPVVDKYVDNLIVKGQRDAAADVDITIRAASDGSIVRQAGIARATGAYRWTWDGQRANGAAAPAALAPAGNYDVAVVLTDAVGDKKTVQRRITLSHDRVVWKKRKAIVRKGGDFKLIALSRNASVSRAGSKYPGGARLNSRKGFAGVVYKFRYQQKANQVFDFVQFKVVGRSPNRHKAVIAVWNKKLGDPFNLGHYDAAKLIGPGFRTWMTKATPGADHAKYGNMRAAVMTWKGLGRKGGSAFDIKKVILTFRVGTIRSATGASVASGPLAKAIREDRPTKGRSVADITGRHHMPKATVYEDPPPARDEDSVAEHGTVAAESSSADTDSTVQAPEDVDSDVETGTGAEGSPSPSPWPSDDDEKNHAGT
jgi:hypothetical protein